MSHTGVPIDWTRFGRRYRHLLQNARVHVMWTCREKEPPDEIRYLTADLNDLFETKRIDQVYYYRYEPGWRLWGRVRADDMRIYFSAYDQGGSLLVFLGMSLYNIVEGSMGRTERKSYLDHVARLSRIVWVFCAKQLGVHKDIVPLISAWLFTEPLLLPPPETDEISKSEPKKQKR